jgi:hypothetical protein
VRDGALRDELEAAARRWIAYGLVRAGTRAPRPAEDNPHHVPGSPRPWARVADIGQALPLFRDAEVTPEATTIC